MGTAATLALAPGLSELCLASLQRRSIKHPHSSCRLWLYWLAGHGLGQSDPVGCCGFPAARNLMSSQPPPTTGPMQARRLRHERGGFARFHAVWRSWALVSADPPPSSASSRIAKAASAPVQSSTTGCMPSILTRATGHRGITRLNSGARTTTARTERRAGQPDLGTISDAQNRMQIGRGDCESTRASERAER